jgi:hypothetical protein
MSLLQHAVPLSFHGTEPALASPSLVLGCGMSSPDRPLIVCPIRAHLPSEPLDCLPDVLDFPNNHFRAHTTAS